MFYQIFCWFILKIHSNSIKNSDQEAELSIFFKKKLTSVFLSLPSCNCHSNKRWYTGGMLRRYPKSNVSCCAVYQQSLEQNDAFLHKFMNIKAHNEADVRHCSSDLCKATIVIGRDIWARVSTSNHCTVGGPWMCQKCSVFFFSLLLPEHLIYKRFLRLSDLKNLSEFFNYWEIPEFYTE